ncbi:MAG: CS domain-containing protein [Sulfolobaceae archaeon]|jgi:HSP20 family molecular chaperone IbpA|nr:CS domain-containing protein [Sulfolobaceae archaeon]
MREAKMPVFKDLDDLIRNLIKKEEEAMRKFEEEVEKEFKEMEEMMGIRSPLYSAEETEDQYRFIIDLPKADMQTLKASAVENSLRVECKTKSGKTYYLKVKLPEDVDPSSMEVEKRKWYIIISFKKRKPFS